MIDEQKRLPASPGNEGPGPSLRLWMWFLIAMLFAFYWTALTQQAETPPIACSEFKALVRADKVDGVTLAGRQLTGVYAEGDLKQATRLARRMVSQWGMSEKLGPTAFARGEEHIFLGREMAQQRDFSEQTAQLIDEEVRTLIRDCEQRVHALLEQHRTQLDALAAALLERELLSADEVAALLGGDTAPAANG